MRAMLLDGAQQPLLDGDVATPEPAAGEVRIRVRACAVCRTDLHIIDGELSDPKLPLILGHQIIGVVDKCGPGAERFQQGQRVGIPWLGKVDETCRYCRSGHENLCDNARFTGYHIDGGYAEFTVADERFCFPPPQDYSDVDAAPLMCAGLIGYRSLRMTGDAERLGIFGFGQSAHIITQVAKHQGRRVFAFTRPGDKATQQFAQEMGAVWAGDTKTAPPEQLDAVIIFAPAGELIPAALKMLAKGGVVVCGGIHMSDIPSFPYELLWEERQIRSVANLTRNDAEEFLAVAPRVPVKTLATTYPLEQANEAIEDFRAGKIHGSAVLLPNAQR